MQSNSRTAIVLSGGASQGAYHIGVLRALLAGESPATNYTKLDPNILTGTSAGSFNAAALLGELESENPNPVEKLQDLWLNRIARSGTSCGNGIYRIRGNLTRFADIGCLISDPLKPALELLQDASVLARESARRGSQFLTSTKRIEKRILDQLNASSFIAMERFAEILKNEIRFDLIQNSKRLIRIGAVRWDTGFIRYFANSDITVDSGPRIIQASSAVPGVFPRVTVNGVEYGDGGVIENSPLQGAVDAGGTTIHVITSLPKTANIPVKETTNTVDTIYRMLVINVTKSLRRDIERYRNVNDGLMVLNRLRESQSGGETEEMLRQLLNRIMRQQNPAYSPITIHVHKPAVPLANLFEFFNFDRDYLKGIVRQGYLDTVSHNCRANGCVIPHEGQVDEQPIQSALSYGDPKKTPMVDPGIIF